MMNLITAINTKNHEAVVLAINEGCNVNAPLMTPLRHASEMTPLVHAILKGNATIINTLLKHGASIDDALIITCTNEFIDAFQQLLNIEGGNVNIINKSGIPLLHLACQNGPRYVKLLLIHGSNPNITCDDGLTPLHFAIKNKCAMEVIKLLVQFKADLNIKNSDGLNAEEVAMEMDLYVYSDFLAETRMLSILSSRRKSVQIKRKKSGDNFDNGIQEKLAALVNADKKMKNSQRTYNVYKAKVSTTEALLSKNNENCIKLRKELAKCINDEIISSQPTSKTMLECPICLIDFTKDTKIYQCNEGHLYCGTCKDNPKMNDCPQCRCKISNLNIRNRALEGIVMQNSNMGHQFEN